MKEAIKFYFQNPGKKPSIDRIDPRGDYEPKNCRLVSIEENAAKVIYPCGLTPYEQETRDINRMLAA